MTNELVSDKHVRIGEMGGRSFGCKSASHPPVSAYSRRSKLVKIAWRFARPRSWARRLKRISINEKRAGPPFGKVRKGRIDLAFRRHVQRLNLRSESASRPLAALPECFFCGQIADGVPVLRGPERVKARNGMPRK